MLGATIIEKEVNFGPKNPFISAVYSNFNDWGLAAEMASTDCTSYYCVHLKQQLCHPPENKR
jgi:hypothetical protein